MASLLAVAMLFFAAILLQQLYQIQVVDHATYAEKAANQHYLKVAQQPRRGQIYDRNGIELAGTTYVYRIGITPKDVRSITQSIPHESIARDIATALNLPKEEVWQAMQQTDQLYVQLKKDVPRAERDALQDYLRAADIGGVRIDPEPRRYYTNGTLASQVIGFTRPGDDNLVGQLGLELYYNDILTGQPGYTYVETDNYGRGELPFSAPTSLGAEDGQNLLLHLDINIQKIVQEELEQIIRLNDIEQGGMAIVMNPHTGAVLAMADYPYFSSDDPTARPDQFDAADWDDTDPATIEYLSASIWRNRVISDAYRPGSTMKTLTAAMAFEEALADEEETFIDRPMQIMGETISCHFGPGHGSQTVAQSFWRSCNPVYAQLSQRLGIDRFYQYIHSFGLTAETGIDLPAETTGLIHQQPSELDMATFSFGENATVTPLQMVTAFASFANGGNLVRPNVVKAVLDTEGQVLREIQPETVRKAISETTAARIKDMLKGVVLYGTGSRAYVEGYSVAGKTSTATYVEGYSITGEATGQTDDYYTLSFASLAPAENPEIVTLVVLNKPLADSPSSAIAAEANGRIVSRTLEYLGIPREYRDSDISRLSARYDVPDVVGLTYAQAVRELSKQDFRGLAGDLDMGDGTVVKQQWPQSGTRLHQQSQVYLYPVEDPTMEQVTIPDFRGRTVHECLRLAADSGLNIRIVGDSLGLAVTQDPLPTHAQIDENIVPPPIDAENEAEEGSEANDAAAETVSDEDEQEEALSRITHLERGSTVAIRFETVEEQAPGSEDPWPEDGDELADPVAENED